MTDTPQAQPEQGQDPQVAPEPAAPAAPAAPPVVAGSGPWATDLNAIFTDDATRGQVDQFLREKVQPYTTQLEQKASATADAQRLYDAFSSEPLDAYVAITEELFGPEAAQQVLGQVQQTLATQQQQEPQAGPQQQSDPRTENLLSWVEEQQNNAYYDQQIAAIAGDPQYADIDVDLLHPFVAAAGGDFEEAVNVYRAQAAQWQQKFAPAPVTPEAEQAPPANVLGSDTATTQSSATPTEPRKQSLNDAIEEFVRESRTAPAPPVGTV